MKLIKFASTSTIICFLFSVISFSQTYNSFYGSIVNNTSSSNILNDLTTFEDFGVKEVGTQALTNAENWITTRWLFLRPIMDRGLPMVIMQGRRYHSVKERVLLSKVECEFHVL